MLDQDDNSTSQSSSQPGGRWQFSLSALFLLMLIAAVVASRVCVPRASWDDHALTAVACLIVLGLLRQARDLWSTHRHQVWQSSHQRDGWIFAVFWRVILSLWIIAVLNVGYLEAYGAISLPESENYWHRTGQMTRDAVLRLTLLVAIAGSCKHRISAGGSRFRSRCIDGLGWLGLFVLCFLICLSGSLLPMLVHVALRGIEASCPLRVFGVFRDPDAYVDLTDATIRFFDWSKVAAALFLANIVLTITLAWQWRRGVVRRLLVAVPLAIGLTGTTGFTVWASRQGFATISPGLAPFIEIEPAYRWFFGGTLIGLAAAAAAAQFCYRTWGWHSISDVQTHRHTGMYLQQRTAILLAMIAICVVHIADTLTSQFPSDWFSRAWIRIVADAFYVAVDDPIVALDLAIVLVALRLLWSNRRRVVGDYSIGPFALSLPAWGSVSCAIFVTMASGLPTLYWFTYALWLNSGYH